jgi:hydroxyethylthiazole kinase-like uncharacterized protein yjeF
MPALWAICELVRRFRMHELLTSAQMRAVEQDAIGSGAVTGLELMERAGRGVVEAVFEGWPELAQAPHRAVVLCGPGNNGGDGFVVARLLKEWGWEVEVFLYGDPEKLPPDARANYERWVALGGVAPLIDEVFAGWPSPKDGVALIVDALFGTGLARPFLGFPKLAMSLDTCWSMAGRIQGAARVVAVDVPSGLCADSGKWLGGDHLIDTLGKANLTVTFHTAKTGHFLADGPYSCGTIAVKEIGLPEDWRGLRGLDWHAVAHLAGRPEGPDALVLSKARFPVQPHKYSHGHALVLSGPKARSGAARLAARGALRVGAGLVTVAAPKSALEECAAQLTAIMLRRCDGGADLDDLLEDARLNALCLGPGLGLGGETRELVRHALQSGRPCVLDADALTVFADAPEELFEILHPDCVLTPHGGEFARLFPDIAERLQAPATTGPAVSKVDATREAAARAGCVVLFKGADTVIADPSGKCTLNAAHYERAAPWLATAGSGDVLTGFIGGLLARGFGAMEAAETAAWLHVECALKFGPGLIAEDLPEMLPQVFRDLRL